MEISGLTERGSVYVIYCPHNEMLAKLLGVAVAGAGGRNEHDRAGTKAFTSSA